MSEVLRWRLRRIQPVQVPSQEVLTVGEDGIVLHSLTQVLTKHRSLLMGDGRQATLTSVSSWTKLLRAGTNCLTVTTRNPYPTCVHSPTGTVIPRSSIIVSLLGRGLRGKRWLACFGFTPFTVKVTGVNSQTPIVIVMYGDGSVSCQHPFDWRWDDYIADVEFWSEWPVLSQKGG